MELFKNIRAVVRLVIFFIAGITLLITDTFILLTIRPFSKTFCRKISLYFGPFWGKLFITILGIHLTVTGRENWRKNRHYCIISNHMSYLDILVTGALFPVLFVSRHDVKYWPLLGAIAWVRGSIFVDRSITGSKERPYVKQIIEYLEKGFNVIIFPEGKTSNGEGVSPFKKTVFSCPTRANIPILPITIQYTRINREPFSSQNRDKVCWYGEMTFIDHFRKLLKLSRIDVTITIHPPVREKQEDDWLNQNRRLSVKIHDIIAAGYPGFNGTPTFSSLS